MRRLSGGDDVEFFVGFTAFAFSLFSASGARCSLKENQYDGQRSAGSNPHDWEHQLRVA